MSKVKDNVAYLKSMNQSMWCALLKAENGSTVEDGYFMEKLEKSASCMGYELKKPEEVK